MSITNPKIGTEAITVTMDALREVDASGNAVGTSGNPKHTFNTFASQAFSFSSPTLVRKACRHI